VLSIFRMKKLLIISLLILGMAVSAQAQDVWKYRTVDLAFRFENNPKWDAPEDCRILVVFNNDQERIQVFSKETQTFDITSYGEVITDPDGDDYVDMDAVDQNGKRCLIRFVNLRKTSRTGRVQLYVHYQDVSLLYNMFNAG
jgi:hypothetical protein